MREGMKKAVCFCMILAAAAAVILPARALFCGDGLLAVYPRLSESRRMLAESAVLFFLFGAVWLGVKEIKRCVLYSTVLSAVFCWLHVVFLPMVLSAVYLGFLLLLGRFFRRRILKIRGGSRDLDGWPSDFVLGSSIQITAVCLLSVAGWGTVHVVRLLCVGCGTLLYGAALKEKISEKKRRDNRNSSRDNRCSVSASNARKNGPDRMSVCFRLSMVYILVMLLIQAGRMNITLDFDTLWYGVRSEYILAGEGGIYDNPGLIGMVYVYSKGFEVLTLPLCGLASYSYLIFVNLWLAAMGIFLSFRIARILTGPERGRKAAVLAAVCTSSLPGIMNMAVSAKTDMITWVLQLIMLEYFFRYVKETEHAERGGRPVLLLIETAGAYVLSLTMKPTSLVFSTALFGMMGIYLLISGRLSFRAPIRHWAAILFPGTALIGIWLRTMLITGMPVTSVFTSIFAGLGFEMKYPFATGSLPQNWQEESNLHVLFRRLYQMLLSPKGKDMTHVAMAWGSSLLFFLLICLILFWMLCGGRGEETGRTGKRKKLRLKPCAAAFHVIFWPFLAVNLVSLVMLYQVDGNYFMMLYSLLLLAFCQAAGPLKDTGIRRFFTICLSGCLIFNTAVTAQSNWAWSAGFSEIRLFHKGRMNHRAADRERFLADGNGEIWQILSQDSKNRVIAFGDHPFCLLFPCNVQSYRDITSPWGNVELVNTPEAFEEYMEYAGTDYVYAEAGWFGPESWDWSYELFRTLLSRGAFTDLLIEEGNVLARVAKEKVPEAEAQSNLDLFDANYRIFGQE